MNNPLIKHIVRFIILILIQVLILNRIHFIAYINPYLYILFILILPVNIPKWLLLIIGFLTGLTIDLFMNTHGLHTSATLLIAYLRPFIIRSLSNRDDYEMNIEPNSKEFGFSWFFFYALFLTLIHHSILFFLEVFKISAFFQMMGKILLSSIISLFFIIIGQYFFQKR